MQKKCRSYWFEEEYVVFLGGKDRKLRGKLEQADRNSRQEQGRPRKLHLSCVWMCECNPLSVVGHFLGSSCSVQVEVGNGDEVRAFVFKLNL
jgi:hypothetical protein